MQDRYAADVGDFGKLGFLREICSTLHLGVVWYRVPDESHNDDGKHVAYLQRTPQNLERYRTCDPELYDALAALVDAENRSVAALEAASVLPNATRYFADALAFDGGEKAERLEHRASWLASALDATADCAVVFLDPDNGFEIKSRKRHWKHGRKYAFFDEVNAFVERGQSVIVYHHLARERHGKQILRLLARLGRELAPPAPPFAVRFRRGSPRAFFVIPAPQHAHDLRARADAMIRGAWGRHFDRVVARRRETATQDHRSPFLELPEDDRVASNELAFAIRDRYPVSDGHTLVIAKRLVATWFDASAEEQRAIMELVAVVKRQLDEEHAPDGYNVGFNAGAAAGQTVMHLHVHVIPRYRGDMDDPRGGVRHVIPSEGNYLLRRKHRPLSTGGEHDPFIAHLRPLFRRASHVAIVAAFVQHSGLRRLEHVVMEAVTRGAHVRILTGDYLHITQADALAELLDWMATAGDGEAEVLGSLEARVVETRFLPKRVATFHPKSWRFDGPDLGVAFVGSSNISRAALETGIEWNLRVDRDRDRVAYDQIVSAFEKLWSERARVIDAEWVAAYEGRSRTAARALPGGEIDTEDLPAAFEPHDVQREALKALQQTREEGIGRGLCVLATGLGKTWLAAFDVRAFGDELGHRPRVLFLAHRREILRQASRTLRTILRQTWPDERLTVGWFAGDRAEIGADLVVASVPKLARPEHLYRVDPHAFDYVIVDEVHHGTAKTYRRVLDHLEPRFLLGLTATPERADEGDVLGLFDDHLVYRADVGVGIGIGRLVPFRYFGLKDDIDYANIPWRNGRFDTAELEAAVQTERRMERMWEAWRAHPATRSLVFCCTKAHADFVRRWLAERGVRIDAIYSGGDTDRDDAIERLASGELEALCTIDMLNEGVDIPAIDRVVMLRPTDSPTVFLQQLGRGLRVAEGKTHLTVIDFVGNHHSFLERVRRLLSLAPAGEQRVGPRDVAESDGPLELPDGCSVDVEVEAKELIQKLLSPSADHAVVRAYREIRDARGERPTAGELQRMGYAVRTVSKKSRRWFELVESEGDMSAEEKRVHAHAAEWFHELETTSMTKCFKMVTLEVLLEAAALRDGLPLDELARKCHAWLRRSPELWADVAERERIDVLDESNRDAWNSYWRKNPIAAWVETGKSRGRFHLRDDRFVPELPCPEGFDETLAAMTRELVDYRLAQYRARRRQAETGDTFVCKVISNQRDPILKLPDRERHPDMPMGDTAILLPDGRIWQFKLVKIAINVARPAVSQRNELPDLLRRWFGPSAGERGTAFEVRFSRSPDGWWIEPVGARVIAFPTRGHVTSFPDLAAAAGAVSGDIENVEASDVKLPVPEAEGQIAVRAIGDSMDGGKDPIRDGDWLVLRYARSRSLDAVEGGRALVRLASESGGGRYQIKRVVRLDGVWILRSDNPDVVDVEASADATVIAKLHRVIRPEDLGPDIGAMLGEEELRQSFGWDEPLGGSEGDRDWWGRVEGHLFVRVRSKGAFVAPDRLRLTVGDRKPGETVYVLARKDAAWRYCGVGRWSFEEDLWVVDELDYDTWRGLGSSRSVSRSLPDGAEGRAEAIVERVLDGIGAGGWVGDPKKCRIVGRASGGGLRIDGGEDGFDERTVSLTDIAWVLVAQGDVEERGGVLDEARVNRLRYLVGTPKGSTRWIDTGWAIVVIATAGGSRPE